MGRIFQVRQIFHDTGPLEQRIEYATATLLYNVYMVGCQYRTLQSLCVDNLLSVWLVSLSGLIVNSTACAVVACFTTIFSVVMVNTRRLVMHINYLCKNCSVYIQCKGDIVVVDIKQHKSQFKNSNFTITVSKVFLTLCNGDVWTVFT